MVDVATYAFDEPVIWAGFVCGEVCYALVDGKVHFPGRSDEPLVAHDGLLCATVALDGKSLLSGGEEGRVVRTNLEGTETLAEEPGQWIDTIAAGPHGACAFAARRKVWLVHDGTVRRIDHERAVEGLAFAPKGLRIAAARYKGVSLHWAAQQGDQHQEHGRDGKHLDAGAVAVGDGLQVTHAGGDAD